MRLFPKIGLRNEFVFALRILAWMTFQFVLRTLNAIYLIGPVDEDNYRIQPEDL
jgi:hypothetical protein